MLIMEKKGFFRMIETLRFVRWIALGLIVLLASGVAITQFHPRGTPAEADATAGTVGVPEGIAIGGPFHLIDSNGHPVTDADYRGRWMLVYFGYTNCPDVCPLTLQKVAAALQNLGPLADRLAPLFISVDPARDTAGQLANYVKNFDPRIIGLTGSDEQVAAVAKAYKLYYSPATPDKSGAYIVDHSSFLYLMDPRGEFTAILPPDADAGELAIALRSKLSQKS